DAAEGPVDGAVRRADKAAAVGQAVNHDVAARADAQLGCTLAVGGVGIRDVQSLVVGRVRVAAVDDVAAFGSAAVALTLLWGEAAGAERDLVGADDLAAGEQLKQMILFEDEDGVCFFGGCGSGRDARASADRGGDQERKRNCAERCRRSQITHASM